LERGRTKAVDGVCRQIWDAIQKNTAYGDKEFNSGYRNAGDNAKAETGKGCGFGTNGWALSRTWPFYSADIRRKEWK
jgi:hypothetical protein